MLSQTLSRLSETVHLDDTFSNKPSESNYDTHINFSNDLVFDIDFHRNRVNKHLSNINFNKASKILINCSESLA